MEPYPAAAWRSKRPARDEQTAIAKLGEGRELRRVELSDRPGDSDTEYAVKCLSWRINAKSSSETIRATLKKAKEIAERCKAFEQELAKG